MSKQPAKSRSLKLGSWSILVTLIAAAVVVAVPITLLFLWLQKYYVQGVTGGAVKG